MINQETFVIPGDNHDEYVVYSPLKGLLMSANGSAVLRLASSLKSNDWPSSLRAVQTAFTRPDLFDPNDRFDIRTEFIPVGAMIELTTNCNLRCSYCYASAGESPGSLPWSVAKATVDLIFDNAKKIGKEFSIFFHGRGEPTSNWKILKQCVDYSKKLANNDTQPVFRMATNGVLNEKQLEYITDNFETISLSLDGPQKIHDRNRTRINGEGSFVHTFRTGQYLLNKGFPFGIKAVVTSDNLQDMPERVEFFRAYFPGVSVGFEPVNEFGRCKQSGVTRPNIDEFISHISEIMYKPNIGNFSYSGVLRPEHIRLKFCGALKPTFGVHVDGKVVACVGVPLGREYADAFCYGTFDFQSNEFIFDFKKISKLQMLLLDQFAKCNTCFAKWNCAGDCASYRLFQETSGMGESGIPLRCLLNRALLRKQLLLKSKSEEHNNGN